MPNQNSGLAGQIDTYLKKYGSPLAGLGNVFVAAGRKFSVDPRLVVGISIAESSGGKNLFSPYNAWGWGVHNKPPPRFNSWEESITTVTRGLRNGYFNAGQNTPAKIVKRYAPSSDGNNEAHWSKIVSDAMLAMGASPSSSAALTVANNNTTPTSSTKPTSSSSSSSAVPKSSSVPSSQGSLKGLEQLVLNAENVAPSTTGLAGAASDQLFHTAATGFASPQSLLHGLSAGALSDQQTNLQNQSRADELRSVYDSLLASRNKKTSTVAKKPPTEEGTKSTPVPPANPPAPTPPSGDVHKWAKMAPGADRSGVHTVDSVFEAVAGIAQAFGEPLTITTGTNHNQFVVNQDGSPSTTQSQHWTGHAADVLFGHGTGPDNVDPNLTRLGQTALIFAGMDPAKAHKILGGAYSIGPYNILFNTGEGGNHYNHLHVGVD